MKRENGNKKLCADAISKELEKDADNTLVIEKIRKRLRKGFDKGQIYFARMLKK